MSFSLMFFAFVVLMALAAIVVGRIGTVVLDATVRRHERTPNTLKSSH